MSVSVMPRWLDRLKESYATYTAPPEAIGMTTRNELCFLESYARDLFTGEGQIVDLGCWYGATTAALARGLQENQQADANRVVHAYDLFRWEPWMSRHTHRLEHLNKSYRDGDSFVDDVVELLAPYRAFVRVEQKDLLDGDHAPAHRAPIEFLFVDAQKSWALGQSIMKSYFHRLLPGKSFMVQQDFVWYHPTILSVHLLMWHMREHFEFVHHVPGSCSCVFRCTSQIDVRDPPPASYFTREMLEEAYDWCFQFAEPARLDYLRAAKVFVLFERGFTEDAREVAREMADDAKIPKDLAGGMHTVLDMYRKRALSGSGQGDGARVDDVDAIAALIPEP